MLHVPSADTAVLVEQQHLHELKLASVLQQWLVQNNVSCCHAGRELQDTLPVFLYGAAHPHQHTLADIRRSLGYFQGAQAGKRHGIEPSLLKHGLE
jgi:hypothetical protein